MLFSTFNVEMPPVCGFISQPAVTPINFLIFYFNYCFCFYVFILVVNIFLVEIIL